MEQLLYLRDARALGILAQSDLDEDVFGFKDIEAGRKPRGSSNGNPTPDWIFREGRRRHRSPTWNNSMWQASGRAINEHFVFRRISQRNLNTANLKSNSPIWTATVTASVCITTLQSPIEETAFQVSTLGINQLLPIPIHPKQCILSIYRAMSQSPSSSVKAQRKRKEKKRRNFPAPVQI